MTDTELKKTLAVLQSAYPNFQKGIDPKLTVNVWGSMFQEDGYQQVMTAVKMYIATEKFAPTIADIREKMVEAVEKNISSSEAWGQITKAISKYGQYQQEAALESMDPAVAQLVKRFGWKDLCVSENQMADRAHFIKLWDSQATKTKVHAMLPNGLRNTLELNWSNNDMNLAIETDSN